MSKILAGWLLLCTTLSGQTNDAQIFEQLGQQALSAINAGRLDEALPLYRRMLQLDPANPGLRFDFALVLNRMNRPQESLKALGAPTQPDALVLAAANHRALGQSRSALPLLRRAFAAQPTAPIAYDLGLTLLDLELFADATRTFERFPQDARCLIGLGLAAQATGKNETAIQHYKAASLLKPSDASIFVSLADLLSNSGNFEEAGSAYSTAISLEPRNPNLLLKSARNHIKAGRQQEAIDQLKTALRLDPIDPDANFELARLDESNRRSLLENAILANPASAQAHYQLMLHCRATNDNACAESTRRSFEHLKSTHPKLNIDMDPPIVIFESPVDDRPPGKYQNPTVDRLADGSLFATINIETDSIKAYGAPRLNFISSDNGLTWRPVEGTPNEGFGLRLKNGDYLRNVIPPALDASALQLPAPTGEIDINGVKLGVFPMNQLSPELRQIFFQRFRQGRWLSESTALDDPNSSRYTILGRFPRLFLGDMLNAPDGSLLALTYPRIADKPPFRFASATYRSTDNGATWKFRGKIPDNPLASAGFTQPALTQLPNGVLYAALRTTEHAEILPMYESRSSDLGLTWSQPKVLAPNGILPRFLRLDNGTLVLASGKPGIQLRFSPSGLANDWTAPWELLPAKSARPELDSCSNTSLVALDRDSFLIVYSWFHKPDSEGRPRKAIIARRIRVTKATPGKHP